MRSPNRPPELRRSWPVLAFISLTLIACAALQGAPTPIALGQVATPALPATNTPAATQTSALPTAIDKHAATAATATSASAATDTPAAVKNTATSTPVATATSAPVATATFTAVPPTPTQALPSASYQGVSFTYDTSLFASARGQTVAAVTGDNAAPWDVSPKHIEFSFDQYVLQGMFHTPKIYVFPVKDMIAVQPQAEDVINQLKSLVKDKPKTFPENLPYLPFQNAGAMLYTNITYVNFKNGAGIRYLTQFGQDVSPIVNPRLVYIYQGITTDGQTYISAIFPINNPILPDDPNVVINGDYDGFSKNFPTYIADLKKQLDAQPPDSFNPSLTLLDGLVKSIQVKP